jgi:hypothetical protein
MGGSANLSSPQPGMRGSFARKSVVEKVFWFFEPVEGLGGQMAVRKRELKKGFENDPNTCGDAVTCHSVQRLRSMPSTYSSLPLDQPNGSCGSPYMYEAIDLMRARSL